MSVETIVYEQKNGKVKIAGLSGGRLSELEFFDENGVAEGNIYLGRITKKIELANGKTGYFVNIGDSRDAFINAEEYGLEDLVAAEGQTIVVQVAQEQRAEKGARLIRSLQLPGHSLVYCPYKLTVEASSRIEDRQKAEEYKNLAMENTTGQEGWIIRTAGVNTPAEKFVAEMAVLRKNFEDILDMSEKVSAPCLLKGKTNPLFDYIARHRNSLRKIIVNARTVQEEITRRFGDDLLIGIVPGPFDDFGLEEAIGEALQKEVRLKSGGRIFIEETKACVAIDVDSGEDRGSGNLGRLNAEAAYEIARQIKLRNLSGKIIIDFAGLPEIRYLNSTIEILEQELRNDYVKNTVFGLSRAGCVEIVRMRRRPSLRDLLTTECTCCQGTGRVEK